MPSSNRSKSGEDLLSMPAMKPARDEVLQRQRQSTVKASSRAALIALRFLLSLLLLLLLYVLWQGQQQAELRAGQAEQRIAQLEALLATTGDELSQSDTAVRAQLKSLDNEVRKLWDNVWKKSKETFASQQGALEKLSLADSELKKIQQLAERERARTSTEISRYNAALDALSESLEGLQSETVSRDQQKVAQQRERQFLLEKIRLLERRVAANEEWVESINTFRQQVNQALLRRVERPSEPPQLQ